MKLPFGFKDLLDFVYPRICRFCGSGIEDGSGVSESICEMCLDRLSWIEPVICPLCRSLVPDSSMLTDQDCLCCRESQGSIDGILALVRYHDQDNLPVRDSILKLKHAGRTGFARDAGIMLAERISKYYLTGEFQGITSVPLHRTRKQRRGYNQSALISNYVGAHLNLPVFNWLLERFRPTAPQSGGPKQRTSNVKGAFRANGVCNGSHMILIDDVMTTGATARECTRILKEAGAAKVIVAVVAWVPVKQIAEVIL